MAAMLRSIKMYPVEGAITRVGALRADVLVIERAER